MTEWLILQTAALVSGFIIDCIVGDPYCIPHPVIGIGKWISFFDKKLRRGNSNPKDISRGAVTVILVALISTGIQPVSSVGCGTVSTRPAGMGLM